MRAIVRTLGRGGRRGIPIHYSWRGKHNVRRRRGSIRITVGVRGGRIIPCISTWRRRVGRSSEGILGNCWRVRRLFSTSGRVLGLIDAHVD
jgi:hypothetical protein